MSLSSMAWVIILAVVLFAPEKMESSHALARRFTI